VLSAASMQSASAGTGYKPLGKEEGLSMSSSSNSSTDHLEDMTGWGGDAPRPPPIPSRPGFVCATSKASDRNGGVSRDRNSSALDNLSQLGEGLVTARRQPLSGTMSVPLGDKRQSKTPAPPPDMDDIE
jgi:hypothetical protein